MERVPVLQEAGIAKIINGPRYHMRRWIAADRTDARRKKCVRGLCVHIRDRASGAARVKCFPNGSSKSNRMGYVVVRPKAIYGLYR